MEDAVSDLVAAFVTYMTTRGLSPRTVDARAMFARARLREWGTYAVDAALLDAYLAKYSGHTRRTYHDHCQAFFSWLVETERLASNPLNALPRPPTPRPRPRPLAREDAARSLLGASGHLRAFLLLGRYAGLRAFEVAKFRGEDIDAESLYVLGKGAKEEVLPTHPVLWDLAQSYPRRGFWFPSDRAPEGHIGSHWVTVQVSRHFAGLGITGASHRNRHLYGTELLRAGANVRVVQELMRHSDLATTIRYLGVDEEEKVAAIRKLSA